jgi:hypothetical protein
VAILNGRRQFEAVIEHLVGHDDKRVVPAPLVHHGRATFKVSPRELPALFVLLDEPQAGIFGLVRRSGASLQHPLRNWGRRTVVQPLIGSTVDRRTWQDDVSIPRLDIDAGAEPLLFSLNDCVRRQGVDDVVAAPGRLRHQRLGKRLEALEILKGTVAAVPRVYVDDKQRPREAGDVRVWPAGPPPTDLRFVHGGSELPLRHCRRRGLRVWPEREHGEPATRVIERPIQLRFGTAYGLRAAACSGRRLARLFRCGGSLSLALANFVIFAYD